MIQLEDQQHRSEHRSDRIDQETRKFCSSFMAPFYTAISSIAAHSPLLAPLLEADHGRRPAGKQRKQQKRTTRHQRLDIHGLPCWSGFDLPCWIAALICLAGHGPCSAATPSTARPADLQRAGVTWHIVKERVKEVRVVGLALFCSRCCAISI